jgi:integrase
MTKAHRSADIACELSPQVRVLTSDPTGRPARWNAQVELFLREKRSTGEVGEPWIARMRWELRRYPVLLERLGSPRVLRSPKDVTEQGIRLLRERLPWETPTFAIHFQALKQFLRWGGNPLAKDRSHWRLPSGAPVHRRWLTREQLVELYRAARGIEQVIVALEGFNGLRRVEVLRLRVKDILPADRCLRILGKGRHGGKWRSIPIQAEVARVLAIWIRGHRDEDRVVPLSRSGADAALQRAARRAGFAEGGIRVSHHDLRRTFGRLANASGMNLVSLQGLFGHASPSLSAHYIGLDLEELRGALTRFESYLGPLDRGGPGVVGFERPRAIEGTGTAQGPAELGGFARADGDEAGGSLLRRRRASTNRSSRRRSRTSRAAPPAIQPHGGLLEPP